MINVVVRMSYRDCARPIIEQRDGKVMRKVFVKELVMTLPYGVDL